MGVGHLPRSCRLDRDAMGKQLVEGLLHRSSAGGVAVEYEHDLLAASTQLLTMLGCQGGSAGRQRLSQPGHREGDAIEVALTDDDAPGPANRLERIGIPVECATLVKDRRLRRIQVLGLLALRECAAAKAEHAAADVEDRKGDAAPQPIVAATAPTLREQQMDFQTRADLPNQAIGWLRKECSSLVGGTAVWFP